MCEAEGRLILCGMKLPQTGIALPAAVAILTAGSIAGHATQTSRTLVTVLAHADDEGAIAPLLARYARQGVQVYMIVVSDGQTGAGQQGHIPRPEIGLTAEDLATVRGEEARCAAQELGLQVPILLGFPDGKLGDYAADRGLIYRVADRVAGELQRLRPDVVITWGPDGGTGHPDHRIVSSIVTQLQRAGAPGVPERLFYMNLPVESMRAMNPQRGAPPLVVPQTSYFTTRVSFDREDFAAAKRSMGCHRTQFTAAVIERVSAAAAVAWNGAIPLIPAFSGASVTDLFP
jgi:LmbE family N-acetylglucosaminyl deacetylase